jgi:aspartyl/asparaginyl-tRNA synthetase
MRRNFLYSLKKKHSLEFYAKNAHLRVRTNAFGAIMRVLCTIVCSTHSYFQEKDLCMLTHLL